MNSYSKKFAGISRSGAGYTKAVVQKEEPPLQYAKMDDDSTYENDITQFDKRKKEISAQLDKIKSQVNAINKDDKSGTKVQALTKKIKEEITKIKGTMEEAQNDFERSVKSAEKQERQRWRKAIEKAKASGLDV